jgi:hypothetical protein
LPKNLNAGISAACGNARKNLLVLADSKISREVNFFVRSFAARITANAAFRNLRNCQVEPADLVSGPVSFVEREGFAVTLTGAIQGFDERHGVKRVFKV